MRAGSGWVLYGLSIGGTTADHIAAENPRVEAVLASTLLDLRDPAARDAAASSRFVSRVAPRWSRSFTESPDGA